MIAAVGSVILTPWNWYNNSEAIQYSLGILGSLIGPLFGILIAGYYSRPSSASRWTTCTRSTRGSVLVPGRLNPNAVITVAVTGGIAILLSLFTGIGDFGWFIGCGLGFAIFALLEKYRPMIPVPPADEEDVSDGATA